MLVKRWLAIRARHSRNCEWEGRCGQDFKTVVSVTCYFKRLQVQVVFFSFFLLNFR